MTSYSEQGTIDTTISQIVSERILMDSWKTPLLEVPLAYRENVTDYAISIMEKMRSKSFDGRPSVEKDVAMESTALSSILFAAYIPYHLIAQEEQDQAKRLLAMDGPGALLQHILSMHSQADTLLVIGDQPVPDHIMLHLDETIAAHPARYLVAGPGTHVEGVLRAYAAQKSISKFHIQTVDRSNGEVWGSSPGPALEDLVIRLFKEKKPSRVLAFEPVRLPATLICLEAARHLGIPVEYIKAPALRRAPSASF